MQYLLQACQVALSDTRDAVALLSMTPWDREGTGTLEHDTEALALVRSMHKRNVDMMMMSAAMKIMIVAR